MKNALTIILVISFASCASIEKPNIRAQQHDESIDIISEEYTLSLFFDWLLSDEELQKLDHYHSKLKRIRFYEKNLVGGICVGQCGATVRVLFLDDNLKPLATEEFSDNYFNRSDLWFAIDEGSLFFYMKGLTRRVHHGHFVTTYQINPDFKVTKKGRYYEKNSVYISKQRLLHESGSGLSYIDQSDIDHSNSPIYSLVYENQLEWDTLSVMAGRRSRYQDNMSRAMSSVFKSMITRCPISKKCLQKLSGRNWSDFQWNYGSPVATPIVRIWSELSVGGEDINPKGIIQIADREQFATISLKEIDAVKNAWMHTNYTENKIFLYIERSTNDKQVVDIYQINDDLSIELKGHYVPRVVEDDHKQPIYAAKYDLVKKGQKTPTRDSISGLTEFALSFHNFYKLVVDQQLDATTSSRFLQNLDIDQKGNIESLRIRVWSGVHQNCYTANCATTLIIQLLDEKQQTLEIKTNWESFQGENFWVSTLNENDLYLFIETDNDLPNGSHVHYFQIKEDFSITEPNIYYGKDLYASTQMILAIKPGLAAIKTIDGFPQSSNQEHHFRLIHHQKVDYYAMADMLERTVMERREKVQVNVDDIGNAGSCKNSRLDNYMSYIEETENEKPNFNLQVRVWDNVSKENHQLGGVIQFFDPTYIDDVIYQINIDHPIEDAWIRYLHYGVINLYVEKHQDENMGISPRVVDIYELQCDFSLKQNGRYIPKTIGYDFVTAK